VSATERPFDSFFEELWNKVKVQVRHKSVRIAEYTSRYPAPEDLFWILPSPSKALDCICQYLAVLFILPGGRNYYSLYCFAEQLAQKAYANRYQGEWEIVQGLIEQPHYHYNVWEYLRANYSDDDIFGNLVPRVRRYIETLRPGSREQLSRKRQRRKVRKVSFRRGYRDHGTLRSNDCRARQEANTEVQESTHERLDRRGRVFAPRNSHFWCGKWFFANAETSTQRISVFQAEDFLEPKGQTKPLD